MIDRLKWSINLDKPLSKTNTNTLRQVYEGYLKNAKSPAWSIAEAKQALSEPILVLSDHLQQLNLEMYEMMIDSWVNSVYTTFLELSHRRDRGDTVAVLKLSEIECYTRLLNKTLTPLEINIILTLDTVYVDEISKIRSTLLE